ncbi:serine protease 27-like protein [Aphelenchoides avenae]|nr:serine protease 27-like protein [Aphelenchus avenae]
MAHLVCALVIGSCLTTLTMASANYKDICGRAFQGDRPGQEKVIVGQSAYNGDWPWLVYVDIPDSGCSASLISENYVITAQHCYDKCYNCSEYIPDGAPLDPVRIGSPDDRNGTVYGVEKIHYYNRSIPYRDVLFVYGHDIAIVKLNRSVEFSALASPICLSDASVEDLTSHGVAVGWGGNFLSPDDPKQETYPYVVREEIVPLPVKARRTVSFVSAPTIEDQPM